MKKSKRFLCMLIAAVMLLGAFPAHAASAPSDVTYKVASTTRLPDGTTGAKVGIAGVAKLDSALYKDFYGTRNGAKISPAAEYLFDPLAITTPQAKANPTVYLTLSDGKKIDGIVGKKIPAGCLVDIYHWLGENDGKFICQYDTRGMTQPFVIPCVPGDDPANPKPKKAPVIRTTFTDVKPGAWYYDAVTAVAKSGLINTILDRDPNGSFKPDAILTGNEWGVIYHRLYGEDVEGTKRLDGGTSFDHHVCNLTGKSRVDCALCRSMDPTAPDYLCPGMSRVEMMDDIGFMAMGGNLWKLKPSAYMKQNAERIAKQKAAVSPYLDIWLDKAAKGETPCSLSPENGYSNNYETLKKGKYRGLESGVLVPETISDWTDLVKPITRAELCVMLYRAGTTEFGSWLSENLTARMNQVNP